MLKLDIALTARADIREIRIYSKAVFGPSVARAYLDGLRNAVARLQEHPLLGASADDVREGLIKGVVFGIACSLIAVYEGYHAEPTAEGVGRATTRTVVTSAVLTLILDYLLTAIML